jgi:ubiquinone/menaquinone biosynthesis C-methylase UbiE
MNVTDIRNISRKEHRTRAHYDRLGDKASLTRDSRFMNIGYWRDHPATLDDAARALIRLVATVAGIGPADRIIDVGCGFADQDMLWVEEFGVRAIDAVNISGYQLRIAEKRIVARQLTDRIRFWMASATNLPFSAATFDKLLCVEAAHHFDTREAFFREAYRVLAPGGLLVTADILLGPGRRLSALTHRVMHIPRANGYAKAECAQKLRDIGFTDIELRSIGEAVFPPFAQFLARRFTSRLALDGRVFAPVRRGVEALLMRRFSGLDFVIASARRPL